MSPHNLPAEPGSYALFLAVSASHNLQIGRLGEHEFPPGMYIYFGSARGSGGVRARLSRHLRPGNRPHWHIDYLRSAAGVTEFCYFTNQKKDEALPIVECRWSQTLAALPHVDVPVPGFGASDCRKGCPAHLFSLRGDTFTVEHIPPILAQSIEVPPSQLCCSF